MKEDMSFILLGVTLTRLDSVVKFPFGVAALVTLGLDLGLFRGLGVGLGLEPRDTFLLPSPAS